MTSDTISYTHWAYFPDRGPARDCAADLVDYVTRIRPPEGERDRWLLLAARDVDPHHLVARHAEVRAIVERHGGEYDGDEASYGSGGVPVPDPMLTEHQDQGHGPGRGEAR